MNTDDGAANDASGKETTNMDNIIINIDDIDASVASSGRPSHTSRVRVLDDVDEGAPFDSFLLNPHTHNSTAWQPSLTSKSLTKSDTPRNEENADFNTYKNVTTRASLFSAKVQKALLAESQFDTQYDSSSFHRSHLSRQNGELFSSRSIDTTKNEADGAIVTLIATQLRTNFLFLSLDDDAIIALAHKFEIISYDVGATIIKQDSIGSSSLRGSIGEHKYYYIAVDGDCKVVKDGKQVHGKFGVIEKGTPFGEHAILFNTPNEVSIIASKPPLGENSIILFRLRAKDFLDIRSDNEIRNLQDRVEEIQIVVNTLSGVDTKLVDGKIIRPYIPSSWWLSNRWSGTILQYVWIDIIAMMLYTALLELITIWILDGELILENSEHPMVDHLFKIGGGWFQLTALTSFVSTFFLAEAFKFWKRFYWTTRCIQGRFNDISLLLASNAPRSESDGEITESALAALDDISRLQTLLHQLYWCSLVGRFKCLLHPEGISYLLSRRLISRSEYKSLIEVGENSLGGHHASLTWLTSRIAIAEKRGEIELDQAAMITVYDKITKLRGLMGTLPDMYDGRMPLAYIHFVHMLINVYVLLSPIALFPMYSFYSVGVVGILTAFYKGIFQLSMMFLDPVDNDKEHQKSANQTVGFDIGVLIRESTNGNARFIGCAKSLPKY